ncbi:uncharacterized protein LOC108912427 isoform X2 [Anoplophora glabripennis]|uniref:uncharacterized protein LOC108912427 isoform X2 n=1 Tax=Anoplophora glabripennis TaxID=217634 RepID=UPI000874AF4D|nr:uncharacterized protein LOC108912427 isoform X2 [Anoplophora glabripennis]
MDTSDLAVSKNCAKVDDIHVIHSRSENNIFGIKSDELKYSNVISFILLKKSTVYINTRNLPELLLHVFIQSNSTGLFSKDVYLVLSSKYICLNLHLKEGLSYRMFFETPLNTVKRPALTRIKDLNIYEISHQGCFFQPVNVEVRNISEPLSIPKCMSHIQNCSDLVTFRGVIKIKRFTDPLPSTTVKIPAIYGFETPGGKVHQIVFSHVDGNRRVFLDCYLSNWHNMLMPLGLVPEMEVIVRHVIPQSKKYLRSTIFTSFEVVSYKPALSFNTVNLYNQFNWGMPVFLSRGKKVPVDVLVWGHVYSIFLLKLSIISECTKCKQIVISPNSCSSCHETECELKFEAKFNALDQYGQSLVMTKSLEVLQVLLNLNPTVFKEWVATFHHIGPYSYNYFDGSTPIYQDFTKYLEKIGDRKVLLDLKCRKVANSSSQDTRRASWYCVEARQR